MTQKVNQCQKQSSPLETKFGQGTLWKGGDIIRS